MVPVVVALVRVYLGWAYVGDRLLSAVVEYEETGWCALMHRRSLRAAHPLSQLAQKDELCSTLRGVFAARYDGQTWVKPPKVLARDRLLGSYEVRRPFSKEQEAKSSGCERSRHASLSSRSGLKGYSWAHLSSAQLPAGEAGAGAA